MTDPVTLLLQEAAALDPAPVAPPHLRDRARRRYRRRRGAAVAASALSVLLVALLAVHRPGAAPPSYAGPGSAEALAAGTWQTLPDPPLAPRAGSVVAWTGSRLLVWGGAALSGTAGFGDGASYDPSAGTWSPLASSPLRERAQPVGVWTGSELVVVGGPVDGRDVLLPAAAAYRPATDTWRLLPALPEAHLRPALVWDGRRVLAVSAEHAAALDPDAGVWTALPDPPLPHASDSAELTAVHTTAGTYVHSSWTRQSETAPGTYQGSSGQEALLLDHGRWRAVPAAVAATQPLWTGHELVSPAGQELTGGHGGAFEGVHGQRAVPGGRWDDVAHGPVDDLHGVSVWTGAALLTAGTTTSRSGPDGTARGGNGAAWDPTTGRWTRLPDAPQRPYLAADQVWTGTALLQVGSMTVPTPPSSQGVLVPRMRLLALVPDGVAPLAG